MVLTIQRKLISLRNMFRITGSNSRMIKAENEIELKMTMLATTRLLEVEGEDID